MNVANTNIINFEFSKNPGSIIKVIGVGGGGGNAVNHMFQQGIRDVDFIVCNTDAQALSNSPIPIKIQLGPSLTEGRGAGNKPEVGRDAALENLRDVIDLLSINTKMVFITAGMGGGTGTGGAPVIAEACYQLGLLTIGIVTIPFKNEGKRRLKQAIDGIKELEKHVDSLLIINNERIREMYGDFSISEAFSQADNVLATAAKGIAEIITVPGYINVDFADVETVMRNSGVAIMGSGMEEGENRAVRAVENALNSPLLNNNDIRGAKNILLNITSGAKEATMEEIGQITDYVQKKAGFEADMIWGNGVDASLGDKLCITIIATGFNNHTIAELSNFDANQEVAEKLPAQPATKEVHLHDRPEPVVTTHTHVANAEVEKKSTNKSEFEVHYRTPKDPVAYKPASNTVGTIVDFDNLTEDELDEIENIPAYKRKEWLINKNNTSNQ